MFDVLKADEQSSNHSNRRLGRRISPAWRGNDYVSCDLDRDGRRGGWECDGALHDSGLSNQHAQRVGHRFALRRAVSFVKRYQPPGYGYTHVFYTGTINADATEIDGHWMLANNEGSGTFLMIRSGTPAKAVTREVQSKEPTR
jgi:hypothetical protein